MWHLVNISYKNSNWAKKLSAREAAWRPINRHISLQQLCSTTFSHILVEIKQKNPWGIHFSYLRKLMSLCGVCKPLLNLFFVFRFLDNSLVHHVCLSTKPTLIIINIKIWMTMQWIIQILKLSIVDIWCFCNKLQYWYFYRKYRIWNCASRKTAKKIYFILINSLHFTSVVFL